MQRSKVRLHDVRRYYFQVVYVELCRSYVQMEDILHAADEPTGSGGSAQGGT